VIVWAGWLYCSAPTRAFGFKRCSSKLGRDRPPDRAFASAPKCHGQANSTAAPDLSGPDLRHASPLNSLEKIHDSDFQRLGQEMQAGERNIHLPSFECSDLSTVKPAFVGKFVLRPPAFEPKSANSCAQTLLNLAQLHQQQFGGTLRKRILVRAGKDLLRIASSLGIALSSVALSALGLAQPNTKSSPAHMDLDQLHRDESHCLVGPEIRNDNDRPISCYCRDALVDAWYVYQTYVTTGKDPNLIPVYLTLEVYAGNQCGEAYDVNNAAGKSEWKWDGPEVIRKYPTDPEIERITPDSRGWRIVRYDVELVYRTAGRQQSKVERFSAVERLPPIAIENDWFIEAYDNGTITVRHQGYTYKATCDISRSFNNTRSITDPKNVVIFPRCDVAIGLVGRRVQPFNGHARNSDGWIVVMWSVGSTLVLRSERDDHTPWRQEEFKIISAMRTR
jgi:hypothetical protein